MKKCKLWLTGKKTPRILQVVQRFPKISVIVHFIGICGAHRKLPFLCVNRTSIRNSFRAGAKALR